MAWQSLALARFLACSAAWLAFNILAAEIFSPALKLQDAVYVGGMILLFWDFSRLLYRR